MDNIEKILVYASTANNKNIHLLKKKTKFRKTRWKI